MTLLDWIILAILVIAGILGLIFGAKKRITRKLGWLVGFVIATMFYAMLTNVILSNTPLGETGASYFRNIMIANVSESNTLAILNSSYSDVIAIDGAQSYLATGMTSIGIPKFFASYFITKIYFTSGTVAMALGSGICAAIAYVVTYVILYFVSALLVTILLRFLLKGKEDGKVGIIDRIAGLTLRIIEASVTILSIMLMVIGISYAVPSLNEWMVTQTNFGSGTVTLSGIFYNLAWQIINAFKLLG